MDNLGSTLIYIVVMVAVLIGAYLTTKYISKKSGRVMKSRYISVLDRMALAKDKSLYLTEVGGKYLLIGVTNQGINTLGEIDKEALGDIGEASSTAGESSVFGKAASFFSNAKSAQTELAKARAQYKVNKKESTKPNAQPTTQDVLEQMSRAIEQRRNRTGGGDGGNA